MNIMGKNLKNNIKKIFIFFAILLFLSNITLAKSLNLSNYDSFSVKFYCSISSIFSKNDKCNSKPNINNITISTNNNDKLVDQITTLQNELNNTKKPTTITYTYPVTNEKIVYIKGEKGDKRDKGDTTVVNNNNNTTNWSSVWIPDPKYQYVPVAGSNGAQGPAGSNGKDGNYITQITQDATNTPENPVATSTTTSTSTDTQIENPPAIDQSSISQIVDEVINNIQDNSSINNTDTTIDPPTSNPVE